MELTTAGFFLFIYFSTHSLFFLSFSLVFVAVLIVIAVYDMRHMVIPNELVITVCGFALFYVGLEAYATTSLVTLAPHFIAAAGTSAFYAGLWIISKGRWIGLGDAKLAFPLALMLSISGAFSFIVLSFWIGAILSIVLLGSQRLIQSGKKHLPFLIQPLTMKSEVPFAPFMILAFIIVFWRNIDVLSIMANLF